MAEKQRTVAEVVTLSGKGLHSGKQVNLVIKPAGENYGYRFQRVDLEGQPVIRALAENVVSTARGTTLQENGGQVMTIEHLCAALQGVGVDNTHIEIDGPEVPIMDGSSKYFIQGLKAAGTVEQLEDRNYFSVTEKVVYREDNGVEVSIEPADSYSIDVHIDFNSKVLGKQQARLGSLSDFETEISSCKTFVFLHELEFLAQNNLIKGGDVDNALIIVDRPMSQEQLDRLSQLFHKPKIEVLPEGYLNNTERTFENEPARHKLLDIVGDLALAGVHLKGKVVANKPGHHANTELAKKIRQLITNHK